MRTPTGLIIPDHFAIYGAQAEAVYRAQLDDIPAEVRARIDAALSAPAKPDAGEPNETSTEEDYW